MTAADFRREALSLPEACEGSHMDHPDFRVRGKIFATLRPDGEWGVVLLTPDEQAKLLADHPEVFLPAKGGWGRRGSTQVRLEVVSEEILRRALLTSWKRIAPKRLVEDSGLTFG